MPRPKWLDEAETHRRFPRCINCKSIGEPCGLTNPIKGVGRATMYKCARHPNSPLIYFDTLACEDYKYGPTGAR